MPNTEAAIKFYESHYDAIETWLLKPTDNVMLGDKQSRRCRFCGKGKPAVSFKKVAHAIPESLGNKSILTAYECDDCNEGFGRGIENDLGNWSKPMRTLARIRGKSGIPTLKSEKRGWRIEHGATGFNVSSYEDDPPYEIDELNRKVTFTLQRDPYVPVAVLKAFMKIGLTLLPDSEVRHFPHIMTWIRDQDHSRVFAESCPIIYTFQPGPKPNDLIAALILRRKPGILGVPYAFLVLGYGNEVFQVQLPSEAQDAATNGQPITIDPFPCPSSLNPEEYGPVRTGLLRLTGRELVKGDSVKIGMGYRETRHRNLRSPWKRFRQFVLSMFRAM